MANLLQTCAATCLCSPIVCSTTKFKGNCIYIDGGSQNAGQDATVYITATSNNDWALLVNKCNSGSTEYGIESRMGSTSVFAYSALFAGTRKFSVGYNCLCHSDLVQSPIVCATTCMKLGAGSANSILCMYSTGNQVTSIRHNSSTARLSIHDDGGTERFSVNTQAGSVQGVACAYNCLKSPVLCATTSVNSPCMCANDFKATGWFRNTASGHGLYSEATGQHFYSDNDDYWNVAGGTTANGIRFRDEHAGTIRGTVYANSSNEIGFLDQGSDWTYKAKNDDGHYWYLNNTATKMHLNAAAALFVCGCVQSEKVCATNCIQIGTSCRPGLSNFTGGLSVQRVGANSGDSQIGIQGKDESGDWRFTLYGAADNYGFLDASWAAWDIKKTVNGSMCIWTGSSGFFCNMEGAVFAATCHSAPVVCATSCLALASTGGSTSITASGARGYMKICGSGDNYVRIGPHNDNGWGYIESHNNSGGLYFGTNQGAFLFDTGHVGSYTDGEVDVGYSGRRFRCACFSHTVTAYCHYSTHCGTSPVFCATSCVQSPVVCATSCFRVSGSGEKALKLGSTDSHATVYLDGSNGDWSGSDYAWIRHDTNKNLMIENDQAAQHINIWNRSNNNICFGTNNAGRFVIEAGGNTRSCYKHFACTCLHSPIVCATSCVYVGDCSRIQQGIGCSIVSDGSDYWRWTLAGSNNRFYWYTGGADRMCLNESGQLCTTGAVCSPKLCLVEDISGDMANGIALGRNNGIPQASWGESSVQTGRIEIGLPTNDGLGGAVHYGMVQVQVDVYEYDGNNTMSFLVGGHNWGRRWYNCGIHIMGGCTNKNIKLAYHECGGTCNGRYIILIGEPGSSWNYGSVHVRRVNNGAYYTGAMDMLTPMYVKRVTCADSYYNCTTGDLRPSSKSYAGYQCAITCVSSPVLCATTCIKVDGTACFCGRPLFLANNINNWDDINSSSGSLGAFEVYNNGAGNDAFFAFHIGGQFATYFGLDSANNRLAVGGWSAGANKYNLTCDGQATLSTTTSLCTAVFCATNCMKVTNAISTGYGAYCGLGIGADYVNSGNWDTQLNMYGGSHVITRWCKSSGDTADNAQYGCIWLHGNHPMTITSSGNMRICAAGGIALCLKNGLACAASVCTTTLLCANNGAATLNVSHAAGAKILYSSVGFNTATSSTTLSHGTNILFQVGGTTKLCLNSSCLCSVDRICAGGGFYGDGSNITGISAGYDPLLNTLCHNGGTECNNVIFGKCAAERARVTSGDVGVSVIIGRCAGYYACGTTHTFVGVNAGRGYFCDSCNHLTYSNTAVGYAAGESGVYKDSSNKFCKNTFIGAGAGGGQPHCGSENTVIGADAGDNMQGAACGNTFIGFYAGYNCTTASNQLVMGSYKTSSGLAAICYGCIKLCGAVYKASGSFLITHPDPEKRDTTDLFHSFVESPTAGDNIYRWQVDVQNCCNVITLPDYYRFLNEDDMVWVSPYKNFGSAYGEVTEDQKCLIVCSNQDGKYNVLLIGTRKDECATASWKGAERGISDLSPDMEDVFEWGEEDERGNRSILSQERHRSPAGPDYTDW